MTMHTTWQPLPATYDINDNGKLDPRERRALPDSAFAFPHQDELHQFYATSIEERQLAANNIRAAAQYYGIAVTELAL
jgi:hypothetical protein